MRPPGKTLPVTLADSSWREKGKRYAHQRGSNASGKHGVKTHLRRRQDFGLEIDPRGGVFLRCPDLQPDLEPLKE
jgi:hypothetical protein